MPLKEALMNNRTQITQEQRYLTLVLLEMGHRHIEVAEVSGVHPSKTSREMRRNYGLHACRLEQVDRPAMNRRRKTRLCICPAI
jgi:IS30 family transposase